MDKELIEKTHSLSGRFPADYESNYINDQNVANSVSCATIEITWSKEPIEGQCEVAAVVVWRIHKVEIQPVQDPTPLWIAVVNKTEFNEQHSVAPLAPYAWTPSDCSCPPEGQACCENLDDTPLTAGIQQAKAQAAWAMSEMPFGEGQTRTGCSAWNNGLSGSKYELLIHRARVEPLCELPRDDIEWIAKRDFIGDGGFSPC